MTQKGKITVFNQKNANEAEASQKHLQGKQKQHLHVDMVTWPAWPVPTRTHEPINTYMVPRRNQGPGDRQSKPGADFVCQKGE